MQSQRKIPSDGYTEPEINEFTYSSHHGINIMRHHDDTYKWHQNRNDGICVTHRPIRKGEKYEITLTGAGWIMIGLTNHIPTDKDIEMGETVEVSVGHRFKVRIKNSMEKLTVDYTQKNKIAIYQSDPKDKLYDSHKVSEKDSHFVFVEVLFGNVRVEIKPKDMKKPKDILKWHSKCGLNVAIHPDNFSFSLRYPNPMGLCCMAQPLVKDKMVSITIEEIYGIFNYLHLGLSNHPPSSLDLADVQKFYSLKSERNPHWPYPVVPWLKTKYSKADRIFLVWKGDNSIMFQESTSTPKLYRIEGVNYKQPMYLYLEPFRQRVKLDSRTNFKLEMINTPYLTPIPTHHYRSSETSSHTRPKQIDKEETTDEQFGSMPVGSRTLVKQIFDTDAIHSGNVCRPTSAQKVLALPQNNRDPCENTSSLASHFVITGEHGKINEAFSDEDETCCKILLPDLTIGRSCRTQNHSNFHTLSLSLTSSPYKNGLLTSAANITPSTSLMNSNGEEFKKLFSPSEMAAKYQRNVQEFTNDNTAADRALTSVELSAIHRDMVSKIAEGYPIDIIEEESTFTSHKDLAENLKEVEKGLGRPQIAQKNSPSIFDYDAESLIHQTENELNLTSLQYDTQDDNFTPSMIGRSPEVDSKSETQKKHNGEECLKDLSRDSRYLSNFRENCTRSTDETTEQRLSTEINLSKNHTQTLKPVPTSGVCSIDALLSDTQTQHENEKSPKSELKNMKAVVSHINEFITQTEVDVVEGSKAESNQVFINVDASPIIKKSDTDRCHDIPSVPVLADDQDSEKDANNSNVRCPLVLPSPVVSASPIIKFSFNNLAKHSNGINVHESKSTTKFSPRDKMADQNKDIKGNLDVKNKNTEYSRDSVDGNQPLEINIRKQNSQFVTQNQQLNIPSSSRQDGSKIFDNVQKFSASEPSLSNEPKSLDEEKWLKCLRKNHTLLIQTLEPISLADKLFEKGCITSAEHDKILKDRLHDSQCRELLSIIRRKPHIYKHVLSSLESTEQKFIADKLTAKGSNNYRHCSGIVT